jgi:hypothetical protein
MPSDRSQTGRTSACWRITIAHPSVRFIYFSVEKLDGKTIEALSVVSLLGQGVADVVVFGECLSILETLPEPP